MGKGKCYINAYKFITSLIVDSGSRYKLVHGITLINSGEDKGKRDGHAWVELNNQIIIDTSKGSDSPEYTTRERFYSVCKINEEELKKYTIEEAEINLLKYKHYGPWG